MMLSHLSGKFLIIWIPAFAGMTCFFLMDNLGSKDTDFYERSLVFGAPPKIIWLRSGNSTVNETITLLRSQYIVIRHFAEDTTATFLPLTQPNLNVVR